jgi:hypothetical protein
MELVPDRETLLAMRTPAELFGDAGGGDRRKKTTDGSLRSLTPGWRGR